MKATPGALRRRKLRTPHAEAIAPVCGFTGKQGYEINADLELIGRNEPEELPYSQYKILLLGRRIS